MVDATLIPLELQVLPAPGGSRHVYPFIRLIEPALPGRLFALALCGVLFYNWLNLNQSPYPMFDGSLLSYVLLFLMIMLPPLLTIIPFAIVVIAYFRIRHATAGAGPTAVMEYASELAAMRFGLEQQLPYLIAHYGLTHLDTAKTQHQLGILLVSMGEPAAAISHLETALATRTTRHGANHPYTLDTRYWLDRARTLATNLPSSEPTP